MLEKYEFSGSLKEYIEVFFIVCFLKALFTTPFNPCFIVGDRIIDHVDIGFAS